MRFSKKIYVQYNIILFDLIFKAGLNIYDPTITAARALNNSAGRRDVSKCLLIEKDAILWALEAGLTPDNFFVHDRMGNDPLVEQLSAQGAACYSVSEGIMKKITGKKYLTPFVAVLDIKDQFGEQHDPADFALVLDGLVDHGNIGTIIRTASGFGIKDVIASQLDFDPYFAKAISASRGKVFTMHYQRLADQQAVIHYLRGKNYQIVATSPRGDTLQSMVRLDKRPLALVVGNETDGVSENIMKEADFVLQIPMNAAVESLNVGVATGISIYELKIKLVIKMLKKYIRSTLGREINVSSKLIWGTLDNALSPMTPYTSTQLILLMVLACDESMSLQQAGKDTATFGDELDQLLKPLLGNGLICYAEKDQSQIQITEEGQDYLGKIWGCIEKSEEEILQGFTTEEKNNLFDYLQRIKSNCIHLNDGTN